MDEFVKKIKALKGELAAAYASLYHTPANADLKNQALGTINLAGIKLSVLADQAIGNNTGIEPEDVDRYIRHTDNLLESLRECSGSGQPTLTFDPLTFDPKTLPDANTSVHAQPPFEIKVETAVVRATITPERCIKAFARLRTETPETIDAIDGDEWGPEHAHEWLFYILLDQ